MFTMDADLQHPPSLIPEMIRLWRRSCEVASTLKHDTGMSAWRSVPDGDLLWNYFEVFGASTLVWPVGFSLARPKGGGDDPFNSGVSDVHPGDSYFFSL